MARSDAENLRRLEALKGDFEKLRTERIRTEDAIERHAAEHALAKARAEEVLGTSDEAKIRESIERMREENTRRVDDYASSIDDVKGRLAAAEQAPA